MIGFENMGIMSLILPSFILGIIIGILSRIDRLRPIVLIFAVVTIFGLLVFFGDLLNYVQDPTMDGMYDLIALLVPFAISSAFAAKGEELVQSFGRRR